MKPDSKPAAAPAAAAPAPRPTRPAQSAVYIFTVARRAQLGFTLKEKHDEALRKLSTARAFDASVRRAQFAPDQTTFYGEILLMGVWGVLEAFLTDIGVEHLTCFPGALQSKQFSLEGIAKSGACSTLIREAAVKEVSDLSYGTFPNMVEKLQEMFNFKHPLDGALLDELNEVKCTRDVYVHGKGLANAIYQRKAGKQARTGLDRKLPLDETYLAGAISKAEKLVNEFFAGGPANYLGFGKVRAFREMWEASCLNRMMPFEKAWEDGGPLVKGGEHVVRPTQEALHWAWSHSEKAIFDFFLAIFNPSLKQRTTDTIDALGRFSPSTPEGQIITSWMESPFWF
jgi:hypothetical protein